MDGTRSRKAVTGVLVTVPALLLLALPALGSRLDQVRRADAPFAAKAHGDGTAQGHGSMFVAAVTISGRVTTPLSPGVVSPVAVRVHNHNARTVVMRRVRVRIAGISAPRADAAHPCTRSDFAIQQMPKGTILRIPAGRVVDLSQAGLRTASWPTLAMRDLPHNQDGCKGALLTLRFRAARLSDHRGR